jgi:thymidine phosphorylase
MRRPADGPGTECRTVRRRAEDGPGGRGLSGRGAGPADLWAVTLALGVELLLLTRKASNIPEAETILTGHLPSGRGLEKFREMVAAQGGDLDAPRHLAETWEWTAPRAGVVTGMDAEKIGVAVIELGGGRKVMTDHVNHAVGFEVRVRIGDVVERGQPLITVFGPDPRHQHADAVRENVRAAMVAAIHIGDAGSAVASSYPPITRLEISG